MFNTKLLSIVLTAFAVSVVATPDNARPARKLDDLDANDLCFAHPDFLDVPGQIFLICPDFCGEGNDWSVFVSNNVAPPFTVFSCISACLPPGEDTFDCTFVDYNLGRPAEVCPVVCPSQDDSSCGLFGLGKSSSVHSVFVALSPTDHSKVAALTLPLLSRLLLQKEYYASVMVAV